VNTTFPIVDDIGVPVRGLFVLMILFALAIGPINLGLLGRWKRRMWLLWTVPLISLVTCVAVFGYMVFAEGWSGRVRTEGFTILDETERRASTIARTAFYSPLTPGDGLRFGTDTEVISLGGFGVDTSSWRRARQPTSSTTCSIDWSGDQHLARGWVTARVPAHFTLRKSENRRERVTLNRAADGAVSAVNGLGADIQNLWYADDRGRIHTGGPVPAGQQAVLQLTDQRCSAAQSLETCRKILSAQEWISAIKTHTKQPEKLLTPNSYLAVVSGVPFLGNDRGLRHARPRELRSVVLGFVREGDDAR
jgi:hypothetical protein